MPMNFVYFNVDQMRGDMAGCYGHPLVKTPNLDRLAREGTRFDQCHVQHTVCSPSRCSFMTGWYPHVRGHRTLWHLLQDDEPNTLKYLKQAGYDVHWIGKNDLLSPGAFADSVTTAYEPQQGSYGSRDIHSPDDPAYMSFLYGPAPDHLGDYHKVERAIELLKARRPDDPPFMLYLPVIMPHCPFTCPQPWYDMYDPDDCADRRPADLPGKPLFHRMLREYRRLHELDEATFRKLRAVYMGMISYIDSLFGRLLDALDETGLADNTAVFFFSDHGEWAGDYGLVEKWHGGLDDCLTRVPMVARVPGMARGHVVNSPTECFDIVPTTLALAGIPCRHNQFGRSMLPQLGGVDGDASRVIFAEGGYDPHEPHCYEGIPGGLDDIGGNMQAIYYVKGLLQQQRPACSVRCTMVRTATHKLVYRPLDVSELYDLRTDPHELHNVYGDPAHAAVQAQLERRLLDWYVHTSDVVPMKRDPRGFPPGYLEPPPG